MKTERLVLWLAALAVFAVVNPVTGLDARAWQEIVLLYGGFAAVVWTLSGGGPLGAFSLWWLALVAWHKSPEGLNHLLLLVAFLGVAALARRTGAGAAIARVVVAANVAVFGLQVAGLWLPLLRLVSPAASVIVYNSLHPHTGLTASTADLACVLAIGLPFCATRRWWPVAALGLVVLSCTSALSGIVAGIVGLTVVAWPRLRAWWTTQGQWRVAYAALGLMATSIACEAQEIGYALRDDRWSAWAIALKMWLTDGWHEALLGRGLGSWQHAGVFRTGPNGPELWGALHFDALQFSYEAGLLGIALALAVAAWAILRSVRAGRWAVAGALVALTVAQFGHFPFHLAAPSVVAALALGEATRA